MHFLKKIFFACLCCCVNLAIASELTIEQKVANVEKHQSNAEIIWIKPISITPNKYCAWGTIASKKDGELVAVFSGDRNGHVCFSGKVQLIRSTDNGETWSKPETIYSSCVDDRDSGIVQMPDGNLLVSFFSSLETRREKHMIGQKESFVIFKNTTPEERAKVLGNWTMRSVDDGKGKKWAQPVRTFGSSQYGAISLKDGRMLFVGKHRDRQIDPLTNPDKWWKNRESGVFVEQSTDNGRTWKIISQIPIANDFLNARNKFVGEPHVVECDDGTLVVHMRQHHKGNIFVLQSRSTDGGKTWSNAQYTDIRGYPSFLLNIGNGKILATYARRLKTDSGIYARVSSDNGKTWGKEIKLTGKLKAGTDLSYGDLGYPSSAITKDGYIISMYYMAASNGVGMYATKWKLK